MLRIASLLLCNSVLLIVLASPATLIVEFRIYSKQKGVSGTEQCNAMQSFYHQVSVAFIATCQATCNNTIISSGVGKKWGGGLVVVVVVFFFLKKL